MRRVIVGVPAPPPIWVETTYFAAVVYAVLCNVWHIAVPMFGSAVFAVLALVCAYEVAQRSEGIRRALFLPVLCALTAMAVQVMVHDEPLAGDFVRTFVIWILTLFVTQSLSLRSGFLHRFALVCFVIGLLTLPYVKFYADAGGSQRLTLDRQVGVANSNDLGAWFGFCSLYFIIVGLETRRVAVRVAVLLLAVVSLLLLGMTVSRGPMLAVGTCTVIAMRRVLKRGFIPLIMMFVALNLAYAAGVFDQVIDYYLARSTVESGRVVTWPLVIERILEAPVFGVGVRNIATFVSVQDAWITPHNAYLLVPLSSGIVPFVLFLAYLCRAMWRTVKCAAHPALSADHPFRLPLLIYTLLCCLELDYAFMAQWAVVCVSMAMCVVEVKRVSHRYAGLEAERAMEPRYV